MLGLPLSINCLGHDDAQQLRVPVGNNAAKVMNALFTVLSEVSSHSQSKTHTAGTG